MAARTQEALWRAKMERTVGQAIDDFIDAKRAENLSPKTLNWYRWLQEKFPASLADQRLASLTLAHARSFVAELQAREVRYEHHPVSPRAYADVCLAAYICFQCLPASAINTSSRPGSAGWATSTSWRRPWACLPSNMGPRPMKGVARRL